MGAPGLSHPEVTQDDAHWRTAGDRIQTLLDASAAGGTTARTRAEQLVGEVTDLYGVALQHILTLTTAAHPTLTEDFAADDLIASLLLVHGLHPHDMTRRVEDALAGVRPYLGSHGGDVTLLGIDDGPDGATVRLQFAGSCKSCPSSAITLELTVEDAIGAAAPEVTRIDVVPADAAPAAGVIPAESLLSRIHRNGQPATVWHPAPGLADLMPGEVGGFRIGTANLLVCRVGDELFAYRDRCGHCGDSLAGAALHRRLGAADPVLRCPLCHAHFDIVHAGAGIDTAVHLEPVPLLVRDGVLSIAGVP